MFESQLYTAIELYLLYVTEKNIEKYRMDF